MDFTKIQNICSALVRVNQAVFLEVKSDRAIGDWLLFFRLSKT